MTTEHTPTGLIGASIRRVEDAPLIAGNGCYVEDIRLPGMLHMAFQRSPYPHARIISIDMSVAKAWGGVVDVVTAIGVAFRNQPAINDSDCFPDPGGRTDNNCDGVTGVVDVVRFIDVAFRNQTVSYCDLCSL